LEPQDLNGIGLALTNQEPSLDAYIQCGGGYFARKRLAATLLMQA